MATRAYNSPGVVVQETVNPSLAPLLANPQIVAIVGAARGYQSATERLVLSQAQTTLSGSHVFPLTTITVLSTAGFDSSGVLEIGNQAGATPPITFTYTSKTATTFVGPSAGSGTWTNGTEVRQQNRSLLKYTGITAASAVVKTVDGTVPNAGSYTLAQGTDPDATVTGDEPWYLSRQQSPDVAPTAAVGAATGLTGTYAYKVAFVNASGETAPGPASSDIAVTNTKIDLSGIPLGPPGTTSRIIYRRKTVATGGDGLFHSTGTPIANNTATTLTGEAAVDATVQANAQPKTGVASGDTVVLTYDYVDNNYFEPTIVDTMGDAVDKYGPEVDANGQISSPLMYAARLAMLNGASELMLVATSADTDAAQDAGLAQLEDEPDVRIVVGTRGSSSGNTSVKAHVDKMNALGFYRQGIVGRDGSAAVIDAATLRAAAKAFNSEALIMVSPTSFVVENSVTGGNMNIGGQYAAAAVAGMLAARDVQVPVTRKNLAGFQSYNDKRTQNDLGLDSSSGLLVIENKGGVLTVRHGVTTNVGSVNAREISVVRAKYDMAHRLKESLDSSVIGVVLPLGRAAGVVQAAVVGILEQLAVEGTIDSYGAVQSRLLTGDPTTVEVRFEYTPAYPINNVVVIFTINTNTGDFTIL